MTRTFIEVRNGYIEATTSAEMDADATPTPGLIEVAADADQDDLIGRAYDIATRRLGAKRQGRAVPVDAFFDLFTRAERIAMRQLARGTVDVPPDDDIADLVQQVELKSAINLDSPRLAAGLDLLIDSGVLQAGRKAQIIAGTVPA